MDPELVADLDYYLDFLWRWRQFNAGCGSHAGTAGCNGCCDPLEEAREGLRCP